MARTNHRFLKNRSKIFFAGGLDNPNQLESPREFRFCAHVNSGPEGRPSERNSTDRPSSGWARSCPISSGKLSRHHVAADGGAGSGPPLVSASTERRCSICNLKQRFRRASVARTSDRRRQCGSSEIFFIVALHYCREFFTRSSEPNHTGAHHFRQAATRRGPIRVS
jgi:hypothetical protein